MKSDASVLIVEADAGEFSQQVAAGNPAIPVTICDSAEQALAAYDDQSILFGDPLSIARVLPEMPTVTWVQSTWAGITPLLEVDRRDYVLTGVKGVFGPQISEYVLGYMLANELKIIQRLSEQQAHRWWEQASGTLQGKNIGVMGTGSIGEAIARCARDHGMKATGLSKSGTANTEFDEVYAVAGLHEFLQGLDYLVAVLPHTPATSSLLDEAALAQLPAHAYFINVGRANVVDEQALLSALVGGNLGGATLDVFDVEPIAADSPLWDTRNLLITGHIAAVSQPALVTPIFLENYRRFIAGESLVNVIDFENGY